jgi:selenide,water dikinase
VRPGPKVSRDLVLVGGGHAHVQVIRRWIMQPVEGVALSVVLDRAEAVYSGMVPAVVAGELETHACTIDLVPLVRRAGGTVVLSAATRIDPEARCIEFADRPPLAWDAASIDVGSTVRGLERPGVREHALSTRPIGDFVARVDARVARLREVVVSGSPGAERPHVAIVGGGAAGFEIACTLHARLGDLAKRFDWSLVSSDALPLPGASARLRKAAQRVLEERGIVFQPACHVDEVRADGLVMRSAQGGARHERAAALVVWATGGAALPVCRESPLPLDDAGFVRVDEHLQVLQCGGLFAAGDCAAFEPRSLPKAGVYAVRQGPVLDANLRAHLARARLRPYVPQHDFLSLLNLGDGTALGGKAGWAMQGRWVGRLKHWIDRRFMRRFQVLAHAGGPSPFFDVGRAMPESDDAMPCGGCAAKLGAAPLEAALARLPAAPDDASVVFGLERPDDAAAFRTRGGDLVLASVDGFRAFDGDAFLTGRIATQNALSDVYAKGGTPRHALALVTVEDGPAERMQARLHQVLAGIRHELDAAGVSLVGGHSTTGHELFVGLSVTGEMPEARPPWPNAALRPGDRLVLTKALGTGVVMAADMRGLARSAWRIAAVRSMLRSNRDAALLGRRHDVASATDVSGFGLLGHLGEMLGAGDVDAYLDPMQLPTLPGSLALLGRGLRSSLHAPNLAARRFLADEGALAPATANADDMRPTHALLFDPQTSGGLLFGVAAAGADALCEALHSGGDVDARVIGHVRAGTGTVHIGGLDSVDAV